MAASRRRHDEELCPCKTDNWAYNGTWTELIRPQLKADKAYQCPSRPMRAEPAYGMNYRLTQGSIAVLGDRPSL